MVKSRGKDGYGGHTHNNVGAERRARHPKAGKRPRVRMARHLVEAMDRGDLSDWDDEELRRGQKRDKNGHFRGRPPKIVPKILHDELTRRTLKEAQQLMQDNLVAAVKVLKDIALDDDVPPVDRVRAIDMMMTRIMGKPPERVEISASVKPFEELFQDGLVRDISEDDNIIDVNPDQSEDE